MTYKVVGLSATVAAGMFLLSGQEPIFTATQAEAGRAALEKSCGQCHTPSLLGRSGAPGELPALKSLSASYQEFIGPRGYVPPLVGKFFVDRWGSKTAAELIARFQETVDFFKVETDTETTVNITAYILQMNGARAGSRPLTRNTEAVVNSVTR